MNLKRGSYRLFTFAGVDVFLHWSWLLVAAFEITGRTNKYSSPEWNALEYLALFLMVMLHEYGHALACLQVRGTVDRIVLWPLGGLAYVKPPQRPAATLWTVAAGPLVNVALIPVLGFAMTLSRSSGLAQTNPNLPVFLHALWLINLLLLGFNILPVYPLDGGRILQSLLWLAIGRTHSLMAATLIGFAGSIGVGLVAMRRHSEWLFIIAAYMLLCCWRGWSRARLLAQADRVKRREDFACPACKKSPRIGPFWKCPKCRNAFDTFQTQAKCPHCGARFSTTMCMDCRQSHPMSEWAVPAVAAVPAVKQTT